ncbi:MAG TPA: GNAT family N-acetyltransferase [Longimicrobium sp.]
MHIRPATPADAAAISALIMSVSPAFTVRPDGEGAEEFFATISPGAIAGYLASPDYAYRVAEEDGALAGVVAIRGGTHLFHLFVSPAFQRRGLSRRLWETALKAAMQAGDPAELTVNSSLYAIPVYEHFGFRPTGPREEKHGVAWVPMKLVLRPPGA